MLYLGHNVHVREVMGNKGHAPLTTRKKIEKGLRTSNTTLQCIEIPDLKWLSLDRQIDVFVPCYTDSISTVFFPGYLETRCYVLILAVLTYSQSLLIRRSSTNEGMEREAPQPYLTWNV